MKYLVLFSVLFIEQAKGFRNGILHLYRNKAAADSSPRFLKHKKQHLQKEDAHFALRNFAMGSSTSLAADLPVPSPSPSPSSLSPTSPSAEPPTSMPTGVLTTMPLSTRASNSSDTTNDDYVMESQENETSTATNETAVPQGESEIPPVDSGTPDEPVRIAGAQTATLAVVGVLLVAASIAVAVKRVRSRSGDSNAPNIIDTDRMENAGPV